MGRAHTFVVHLCRASPDMSWGLRLVGGSDLDTPLIITKVNPGTPAARELIRGDIIAKVDEYDARDIRHEDAQNLFRNAGNNIKLVVQRDSSRVPSAASNGSTRVGSVVHSPLTYPPYIPVPHYTSAPVSVPVSVPAQRNVQPGLQPVYTTYPVQVEGDYRAVDARGATLLSPLSPYSTQSAQSGHSGHSGLSAYSGRSDEHDDESIVNQPYRTTPLVLPGAKVKREPGHTESYLRHHPNPAMRAAPHHDYRDVLMRQKVAESVLHRVVGEDPNAKIVHKQFNSPIGLYSDNNIANSIRQQTNNVPLNGHYGRPHVVKSHKTTVLYDPAQSETFKMLQEDSLGDVVQEVATPPQSRVFQAPTIRVQPTKRPVPPQKQSLTKTTTQTQNTYVSTLNQEESIQQSNSFKRLMYNVLGESEF